MIDVNYKYISNLETGRSAPSLEVIMKLCDALRTTPDYLLLGTNQSEDDVTDKELTDKIKALDSKSRLIVSGLIDLLNAHR